MAEETSVPENRLDFGKLQYGCEHYRRRCRIRAPCCNRIFACRHCHNDAMSSLSDPMERHELLRQDVTRVVCAICDTEQPVAKVCFNCGVDMGEYFCEVCKFYDDETDKKQFHCDECGICRVGGRENFFHCQKCGLICFEEAANESKWCKAMEEEVVGLLAIQTWDLVALPEGKKAIGLTWVLRIKYHAYGSIQNHNARRVMKGYSHQ